MRYSFAIGDWSDDGHGKCDYFVAEVSGDYSQEEIVAAYELAKRQLGFGLEDIACEYDSTITDEQRDAIIEYGFKPPKHWVQDEEPEWYFDGLDEEMFLAIFVSMIRKHLMFFNAEIVKSDLPSLFGESNSICTNRNFVGYGTFVC